MLLNFGKASEISIYPFTGNPVITRFAALAEAFIYISHFNWLLSAANIVSYNIVGGIRSLGMHSNVLWLISAAVEVCS